MNRNIEFSECLNMLLSALSIKSSALARSLSIDTSLVNRWLHGKRTPSYRSYHIERIARFISENILNSYQKQRIVMVLEEIDGNIITGKVNIDEMIKKVLLEAQGFSIESKKSEKPKEEVNGYPYGNISRQIKAAQCVRLSSSDTIIMGARNILLAELELMNSVGPCMNENSTAYISLSSGINMFYNNYDLYSQYRQAIQRMVEKGWTVKFLLRIDHDLNRALRFIEVMYPLLGTGCLIPYTMKKYDSFKNGMEIIAVPGKGAIACFVSNPMVDSDCAFYLKNLHAVEILSEYFSRTLDISAQQLIKYYSYDTIHEYIDTFGIFEKLNGNRYVFRYGFSVLTLPVGLYGKMLGKMKITEDECIKKLKEHQARLDVFHANLKHYEYLDICVIESIDNLIAERRYTGSVKHGEIIYYEPEDIIEHLKHIVYLLENYENYRIALINENQVPVNTRLGWMIKEKYLFMFEILNTDNNVKVCLSIEEPTMLKAFEEYFLDIWNNIAPVSKDKQEIIKWLNDKIEYLKIR